MQADYFRFDAKVVARSHRRKDCRLPLQLSNGRLDAAEMISES